MRNASSFALILAVAVASAGCSAAPPRAIRAVSVADAPRAAGPYSQAVVVDGFVYTAGQTPRDPVTGKQVEGDIVARTNRVFDNLEAILRGAGCTLQDVVKVTVFMADLGDFERMNEVFSARFGASRPARSTVQVAKLPGGAQIEIEMIARARE